MSSSANYPDILGLCETFLDSDVPDNLIFVADYAFLRKDRGCTINKTGGGIVLYFRSSLNCNRKKEIEISNIETLWSEISKFKTISVMHNLSPAKCIM